MFYIRTSYIYILVMEQMPKVCGEMKNWTDYIQIHGQKDA